MFPYSVCCVVAEVTVVFVVVSMVVVVSGSVVSVGTVVIVVSLVLTLVSIVVCAGVLSNTSLTFLIFISVPLLHERVILKIS